MSVTCFMNFYVLKGDFRTFHSTTFVCIPYFILLNEKSKYNNKERMCANVKEVPSSRKLAERKRHNAKS